METIIQKRIERLILFNNEKQKSDEWYEKRHSMVTASDIAAIFDVNPYSTKQQLLRQKCRDPKEFTTNEFTQWGELFEPVAQSIYKKQFLEPEIFETGCIPHSKYDFIGASPDGILPCGKLIEIKCPKTRTINAKKVPHIYWIQMQIQMEVCNLNKCDFFQCKFYQYADKQEYISDVSNKYKGFIKESGVYWRLDKFTNKTITRDTKWFMKHVGMIKQFWDMVLHYRKVGIETLDITDTNTNITDWSEWITASHLRNHLMGDPCLDYIEQLNRSSNSSATDTYIEQHDAPMKSLQDYITTNVGYGNTFMEMICNKGIVFEHNVVKLLKDSFRVKMITSDKCQARSNLKYKETIDAMKRGWPVIYHGVVHNHETKTYGIPDLLVRSDYLSSLVSVPVLSGEQECVSSVLTTGYHYVVVDIKYSVLKLCADGVHLVNSGITKASKGQLYIYNEALGVMQGYKPDVAYILGKKWKYTHKGESFTGNSCFERLGSINFTEHDVEIVNKVEKAVTWRRDIMLNFDKYTLFPPSDFRLYPNMCNSYDHPYHHVKEKLSREIDEITNIWYCNATNRLTAFNHGITKWTDTRCTTKTLGITSGYRKPRIQAILDINKQNRDGIRCLNFQNASNWGTEALMDLYVDFETVNLNETESYNDTIYSKDDALIAMIGCGWSENGAWMFRKFTVNLLTYAEERRIIDEFYAFMNMLKNTANIVQPRVFHWGHIERTLLSTVRKRHVGNAWYTLNWVDLCKIVQDEIIVFKGALKYNLKEVANALYNNNYTNTCWKTNSKCVNGLDAMVNMLKCNDIAVQQNISLVSMSTIQDIEKYNEIDCKVMWEILTVLRFELKTLISRGSGVGSSVMDSYVGSKLVNVNSVKSVPKQFVKKYNTRSSVR
jgi:putative phage-type endonuclease